MANKPPPFFTAPYGVADAAALQAVARGNADATQQKRALDWIINVACATYQISFQPGMPDATAFMDGRRYAGTEIVKLLKLNLETIRQAKETHV